MRTSLAALAAAFMLSGAAQAQSLCSSHDLLAKGIAESSYAEALAFTAKVGEYDMEFYLNPSTGTWTMISIAKGGLSCIRAAGTDFEAADLSKGDPS